MHNHFQTSQRFPFDDPAHTIDECFSDLEHEGDAKPVTEDCCTAGLRGILSSYREGFTVQNRFGSENHNPSPLALHRSEILLIRLGSPVRSSRAKTKRKPFPHVGEKKQSGGLIPMDESMEKTLTSLSGHANIRHRPSTLLHPRQHM